MVYDYKEDTSGQEEVLTVLHALMSEEGEFDYKDDGINATTITLEHDSNTKLDLTITISQDFLRDCITDALTMYVKKKG
jgi:hypothetical protein